MQVNSTSTVTSESSTGVDTTSLSAQTLSQNDFLKLLVAQMTAQNPLNPLDNQDLLTQTVQFSTLQQNTNLQSTLGRLQANALLGRQVTVQVDASTTTQGLISGVELDSATPKVLVNGTAYDLNQIIWISTPSSTS
jgi:flagellar basal-body rod modification protein FlgD